MHRAILLAATLGLAACQKPVVPDLPEGNLAIGSPKVPPVEVSALATADPVAAPKIALDGEGLRFVSQTGNTRLIAFGTPRALIEKAAAAALGSEGKRSALEECGAGPMQFTTYTGLKLNFQDDKFLGWTAEDDAKLTTMDGIGPGTKRSKLEAARAVTMTPDSTLGAEFSLGVPEQGSIGGFFGGSDKPARVASLYAGLTCFFR